MFFGSFSWSFVYISLPFHIQRISTSDAAGTLTWTGWIMGVTPLATVVTAPLWGRWAERGNPKTLYAMVQVTQGLAFLGTAAARTLIELFLCRIVLGITGAASTFAFVSAGRSDDPRDVRRQVAAIQSGMTIGQVIGPLVGAIAAARLGFRASFVLGAVILFGCGALVRWGVPDQKDGAAPGPSAARPNWRDVFAVAGIVLGGSTQIFFLTSILPRVLSDLGVADDRTLEVGALLTFLSAVAAPPGPVPAARLPGPCRACSTRRWRSSGSPACRSRAARARGAHEPAARRHPARRAGHARRRAAGARGHQRPRPLRRVLHVPRPAALRQDRRPARRRGLHDPHRRPRGGGRAGPRRPRPRRALDRLRLPGGRALAAHERARAHRVRARAAAPERRRRPAAR